MIQKLIEAKKAFKPISKSATNPHYKNKYMTLDDIVDAVSDALASQGLVLYHSQTERGLKTILTDGSNGIESFYPIRDGLTDQQLGSALTYGRRYSICCLLGIVADEDDDGNKASQPTTPTIKQNPLDKLKKELSESKGLDQTKSLKARWEYGYESLHALGVFDEGLKLIKQKMEAQSA